MFDKFTSPILVEPGISITTVSGHSNTYLHPQLKNLCVPMNKFAYIK